MSKPSIDVPSADLADPLLELIRKGRSLPVEQFLEDLKAQRLGKRRDPRTDVSLPLFLTATDVSGRPLDQRVATLNVSRRGALLAGIHGRLRQGDTVLLARGHKREQFRVAWVGEEGSTEADQIGVTAIEPKTSLWDEILKIPDTSPELASIRNADAQSLKPRACFEW